MLVFAPPNESFAMLRWAFSCNKESLSVRSCIRATKRLVLRYSEMMSNVSALWFITVCAMQMLSPLSPCQRRISDCLYVMIGCF